MLECHDEATRRLHSLYSSELILRPTVTTATTIATISSTHIISPTRLPLRKKAVLRLVPHVGSSDPCFLFDIIDRELERGGPPLRLGRHSDRTISTDRISFKSKVVSRVHAEIWVQHDGKVYIKDTGSSTGTFVNQVRLSTPRELVDGDLIQLGTDYKGGHRPIYRSVRIRLELDRQHNNAFQIDSFQQLLNQHGHSEIQECCICFYCILPFQALFVAPCSHMYHYRCLHPVLSQQYPGFSCPLCKKYSNLDESVTTEEEDYVR